MEGRKKYLAKNTGLFALNSIGTKLITFFLVPVYTAALVTSDYGIADLVSTVATIIVPIITLNISEAVMRFSLDEDADCDQIMSIGITIAFISSAIGLISVPIVGLIDTIRDFRWYVAGYCIVHGLYQVAVCYLRGTEQLAKFAGTNIIHVFSTAIFNILFLLVFKLGLPGYFQAHIMGYVVGLIFAVISGHIYKVFARFSFNAELAKNMIRYSIVLVPTSFMWWIMNSSDRIMVTAMVGAAANGIYAISYKIPTVLSTMSTVFNQAWSYSAIKEDNAKDRDEFNNKMYETFFSVQILITGALLMIIKPLLRVYISASYYSAWKYTPYLLIGFLFMSLGTFLSTSYTVNKDSKGFLISGTLGAIMNIVLNWMLIPVIGSAGAALATCISYITVFLYRIFDTKKYLNLKVFKYRYLIEILLLVLMSITLYLGWRNELIILVAEFLALVCLEYKFTVKVASSGAGLLKNKLHL